MLRRGACFFAVLAFLATGPRAQDSVGWRTFSAPITSPDNAISSLNSLNQCDQTIREEEGWIFSPGYPSDYEPNRMCTYVVDRLNLRMCEVELTVIDFDVEATEGCFADFLEVENGPRLCGTLAVGTKKKYPFTGRSLTLRFRSDAQRTSKGFMLQIKQLPCTPGVTQPVVRGGDSTCNQFVSTFLATIYSPGYPGAYPANAQCTYTIQRANPRVCRFSLNFRVFDVEYSGTACWKDFLELPDGSRLCGSNPGKKFVMFPPGRDAATLKFITDSYGSGRGFDIELVQIPESCGSGGALIPQPGPDVGPVRGGRLGTCDQSVVAYTGRFASPGFPGPYPPFQRCTLTIRRASPTVCRVELDIRRLDLERGPEGCSRDYLLLPDRTRICGSFRGKKILEFIGDAKYAYLYFLSDAYRNDWGFEIIVTQLPGSCISYPPAACDQKATGYVGRFTSPGYPGNYLPGQLCAYSIRRADASVCEVELDFRMFDIQTYQNTCTRDFLEMPDGTLLCGRTAGRRLVKFTPFSDVLTLRFNSDGYGSGQGFDIFVRQKQNSCGQTQIPCQAELSAPTGRLTSPGFPLNYAPRLRCRYTLRRPDPHTCRVRLTFPTFDIESSTHCAKDYLELPDRTRLCGKGMTTRLLEYATTQEDETLDIYFVTDGSGAAQGFDINVVQIPNSCDASPPTSVECDKKVSGNTAVITSPSYPAEYPANSYCTYTVYRLDPTTCNVLAEFLDFDLEDSNRCLSDYLDLGGDKYCGTSAPGSKVLTFTSGSPYLTISFKSDQFVSRRGFQLRLTQEPHTCFGPSSRVCSTVYGTTGLIRTNPSPYLPDTDCYYQISRSSSSVCQVSFYFRHFDVGSESDVDCIRDYLEIQGVKYCGRRSGQTVVADFPSYQNQLTTRFKTDGYDQRTGFIIEVTQQSHGCPGGGSPGDTAADCGGTVKSETFQLSSPGYGRGATYPSGRNCRYTVRKASFDVCALEVRFTSFDLEETDDCDKDYLKFGEVALCGRLDSDTTRTFEFLEDELIIEFKSDAAVGGTGFYLTGNQIKC